jgi:hypothetical protein
MKNAILILFVLISMLTFGQKLQVGMSPQWREHSVALKGTKITMFTPGSVANFDSKQEYTTLYLVDMLEKYFEECYKDSFQVDVFVDPNTTTEVSPGIFITTAMGGGCYKKEWRHKDPNDLKAFYEYLKNKLK